MSKQIEVVNLSDVGLKRPHNEDSAITDSELGLLILADGMGGYKAGEIASAIAVTSTYEQISKGLKQLRANTQTAPATEFSPEAKLVKSAIIAANTKIYKTATEEASCQGMGTTIVIGLVHGNILTVAHVGDSRLYRVRGDTFEQVTRDHSLIQELIDRGFYTPEEAAENTPKNLVTRALGIENKVEVDVLEEPIQSGDVFLLCSDGLNDMVKDEEIHLTLSKYSANLVQAAEELVQKANANGGKDNTSIILMKVN